MGRAFSYVKKYFMTSHETAVWSFFFLTLFVSKVGINHQHILKCVCTMYFFFLTKQFSKSEL